MLVILLKTRIPGQVSSISSRFFVHPKADSGCVRFPIRYGIGSLELLRYIRLKYSLNLSGIRHERHRKPH